MKTKKLLKKIEEHIQDRMNDSYSEGYDDGYDNAVLDTDLAFRNGVEAERERVIGLFKMLSQQELVNGSAQRAKAYAMAADTVAVANDLDNVD